METQSAWSAADSEAAAGRFMAHLREAALAIVDESGRIRTWNAGAEEIFGYRAAEVIGKDLSLLEPSGGVSATVLTSGLDAARSGGRSEFDRDLRRADGRQFTARVSVTRVLAGDGRAAYGVLVRERSHEAEVATEHQASLEAERRARLEAESASQQLRAIQRVTEVGLAWLPFERLMSALLERVAELLAADTAVVLLRDGDELQAVAALGIEEEVEQRVRVPLGAGFAGRVAIERRPVIVEDVNEYPVVNPLLRARGLRTLLGVPLLVEGELLGVLHVGSLTPRDFTAEDAKLLQVVADRVALALSNRRLAEAEHEARTEAATAAATARLREQFLGITAHELKTPLTVVAGYAGMLRRALERGTLDDAVLHAAVEEIATHASRLDRLINDLLETSRVHEGRLTLNPEPMDLSELARDVVKRFVSGPEASERHRVIVDAPDAVCGEWDMSRLDQVVTNLVSNAIKYSPQGGDVTIRVRRRAGGGAALSVDDRGIGIPAEAQRDLFQPFSRLAGSAGMGGIGLGLFLASQFVRRHAGAITVRSEVSRGSTFTVELPARAPIEEEGAAATRE
ncbi:MAG: PAS domain-containing sensor histidine kinase [Dehalococcoidia bacterium]